MAFLIRMLENTKTLEHFLNSWITNVLGETLTWSKVEITWIIIIILLCVGKCSQSLGAFGPSTGGGGGQTHKQRLRLYKCVRLDLFGLYISSNTYNTGINVWVNICLMK